MPAKKKTAEEEQQTKKSSAKNTEDKETKKRTKKSAAEEETTAEKPKKSPAKTAKTTAAKEKKTKETAKKSSAKSTKTTKKTESKTADEKTKEKAPAKKTSARSSSKKFTDYDGKTLIIVESPTKARTLEKLLGSKYKVLASVGHVRDLPKGRLAIDLENNFEPEYIQVRGKADLIKTLKGAAAASSKTFLAADPDREGEAIAWHLADILGINPSDQCRIRMHEITSNGVKNAISSPDTINMDLVSAQQARRVLDRLVGYQISPILWYKVQRGLSAGRVQSVALRIMCEREEEIEKFIPEEYWLMDVLAQSADESRDYKLRVEKYNGKTIVIHNKDEAETAEREIREGTLIVDSFSTKESAKEPPAPFKTSTLQQEASRRLGFAPKRTMRIAQSLFEGVDLPGRGPVGLITYMRTDSLRLAPEAQAGARAFIGENFGAQYLPSAPREYTPKGKAQDAHEAVRATDPRLTPKSIEASLTPEQYKLYDLIWSRFIASQMTDAKIARSVLLCSSAGYQMKQSGAVITFDGWGRIYPLGIKNITMEPAHKGEQLFVTKIEKEQKYTQPQPRYTDAGLVKVLEEKGIGRPSTYAAIIDTLSLRGYVVHGEEDKRLAPTKLGRIVNSFLIKYFSSIVNEGFTAEMETKLDEVEGGNVEWHGLVGDFWKDFKPTLDDVSAHAEAMHPEPEKIGESCPECGKDLIIKNGRFGEFIACTGYPDCKYTRKIVKTTGIKCPKCGQGELVRRKATKGKMTGRFFYGCERYPECDYVSWKKPAKNGEGEEAKLPEENDESEL